MIFYCLCLSQKDENGEDDDVLVGKRKIVDGKPLPVASHHRHKMALALAKVQ